MRGFIPTIEPHQSTQTHARRPEPRPSRGDRDAFREAFVQAQERHRSARAPRAANSRQGSAAIDGATDPTRNGDRHLKVAGASRDKKGALSPRAEDAASPGPDKTSTNSPGDGDLTGALNTAMAAAHAPAPAGEGSDASLGAVADNHANPALELFDRGDEPRSWWRCRRGRRGERRPSGSIRERPCRPQRAGPFPTPARSCVDCRLPGGRGLGFHQAGSRTSEGTLAGNSGGNDPALFSGSRGGANAGDASAVARTRARFAGRQGLRGLSVAGAGGEGNAGETDSGLRLQRAVGEGLFAEPASSERSARGLADTPFWLSRQASVGEGEVIAGNGQSDAASGQEAAGVASSAPLEHSPAGTASEETADSGDPSSRRASDPRSLESQRSGDGASGSTGAEHGASLQGGSTEQPSLEPGSSQHANGRTQQLFPLDARRFETVTRGALEQMVRHVEGEVEGENASLKMQLSPGRLGDLELKLEMDRGVLTARFVAASEEVRAMIESALPDLRRNLADQGVTVSELSVFVGQSKEDGETGDRQDWDRRRVASPGSVERGGRRGV